MRPSCIVKTGNLAEDGWLEPWIWEWQFRHAFPTISALVMLLAFFPL